MRDLDLAIAYYTAVTQAELEVDTSGPHPLAVFKPAHPGTGVAGNLYVGTPAPAGAGPTVHLAAPGKLEATLERVKQAGGTVVSDPIPTPGGRFAYTTDLDGNSVGVYEAT